jgi:hypothetical protein
MPLKKTKAVTGKATLEKNHWAYFYGKLSQAVGVLVTNPFDVRNRVWVAAEFLLQIPPEAIPAECRKDVAWIQHMLKRYPKGEYDDSAVSATYRRTRTVTAHKIAKRVWHVYHVYDTALHDK